MADSLGKEKREEEQVEVLGLTSFQTFSPLVIGDRNKTNTSNDSVPMECVVSATAKSRILICFAGSRNNVHIIFKCTKIGNVLSKEQKIQDTTISCQGSWWNEMENIEWISVFEPGSLIPTIGTYH